MYNIRSQSYREATGLLPRLLAQPMTTIHWIQKAAVFLEVNQGRQPIAELTILEFFALLVMANLSF